MEKDDKVVRGTIHAIPNLFGSTVVSSAATLDQPSKEADAVTYTIMCNDGTFIRVPFEDLVKPSKTTAPASDSPADPFSGLPHFLQRHAKVTIDHQGRFHKGYLGHTPEGGFRFEMRRNLRSIKIDWTVPLPNFEQSWTTMVCEDYILPGHTTVSSFLHPKTSDQPLAKHVSAKNLLLPCPSSLQQALHPSNPDRHVWLDSYNEEK